MKVIEPRDGNLLRNMLRQRDLPQCVLDEYWRRKVYLDRVSGGFSPSGLVEVILASGVLDGTEIPQPAESPRPKAVIPEQPEEWPEGALKKGLPVQTFYEGQMVDGTIASANEDEDGFFAYGVEVEGVGKIVAKDNELEIPGEE